MIVEARKPSSLIGLPSSVAGLAASELPQAVPQAMADPVLASEAFVCLIPRDFARQHLIISQGKLVPPGEQAGDSRTRPRERFCISTSTSAAAIHNVGVFLEVTPVAEFADEESIARAIDQAYKNFTRDGRATTVGDDGLSFGEEEGADGRMGGGANGHGGAAMRDTSEVDRLLVEADRDLLSTQGKGPIVKLVDALLFEALSRAASDIHIHPLAESTLVRYRVDGVLHTARELSRRLTPSLVSRIKVMARMDIAERRIPQDGRASVTIGDRGIDLRISTLPTSGGERVVIRLLDNTAQLGHFQQLGMPEEMESTFLNHASASSGMILLTGPTGSGKTTTLYATLRTVGSAEVNVMTIEDPVEYELSFDGGAAISQSQVNPKKGVTFATGLRHILRQDPDIVMVGEIRDGETARIAIQSSLTGHLVFSTLHTNDAASAITRLMDLGIEPYLVSASLSCVLAQRLVRTMHRPCGGTGCEECFGNGFKGRTGIFELLVVDDRIRGLIASNASLAEVRLAARHAAPPMRTLAEDGQRLIDAGVTTLLEVQRVVQGAA